MRTCADMGNRFTAHHFFPEWLEGRDQGHLGEPRCGSATSQILQKKRTNDRIWNKSRFLWCNSSTHLQVQSAKHLTWQKIMHDCTCMLCTSFLLGCPVFIVEVRFRYLRQGSPHYHRLLGPLELEAFLSHTYLRLKRGSRSSRSSCYNKTHKLCRNQVYYLGFWQRTGAILLSKISQLLMGTFRCIPSFATCFGEIRYVVLFVFAITKKVR